MIVLAPTTAIMLYLMTTLLMILGIWSWRHYKTRRQKVITIEKELVKCEYCHFAYLDEKAKEVSQCPQCHSFNH